MMKLFQRIDLSNRPLLLLCGNSGSGKHALLSKSGLTCEYLYPDENALSQRQTPAWFFSENAVYVSGIGGSGQIMPEDKAQAESGDEKQKKKKSRKKKQDVPVSKLEAFYAGLKRNRVWRKRAIDGALFVVDIEDIIKSDAAQINKIAAELRGQADAIVSMTGYRIPVYFIFSKSDKIEGFRELFSDKNVVDKMPYVGSLVHGDGVSKLSPKELFTSYYKKVYDVLKNVSVHGVINSNRRELLEKKSSTTNSVVSKTGIASQQAAICRLTQEFLLAESKISEFVEAFFVDRGRDRPQFGGFFFTSSMMERVGESPDKPIAFSNRVLLGDVIPNAKHNIKEAGEGTLFHLVKKSFRSVLVILFVMIACILIPGSALRDAQHLRAAKAQLTAIFEKGSTLESQYAALSTLLQSYEFLENKHVPPGRVIFGTGKASAKVLD
ncbi:MAG: type VI secretion system protein, partial [Chitinispirillia bacterium]|nr:type VI secretion system protein [Chitinispirillia bacterium]